MSVHTPIPVLDFEKQLSLDERNNSKDVEVVGDDDSDITVLENERDIATHVISIQDDSSLNPWTLRAFIIGMGLSAFGAVLGVFNYLTECLPFGQFLLNYSGDLLFQASMSKVSFVNSK